MLTCCPCILRYGSPAAGPLFSKGVGDAMAAAQDKALEALAAYLAVANERHADK